MSIHKALIICFLAVGFMGCEREHPAKPAAQKFLDALRFSDLDTAWNASTASIDAAYCSDEFERVLDRAKEAKKLGICGDLDKIGGDDVERATDEIALYLQIQKAVCETSSLDCNTYSRWVFDTQFGALPKTPEFSIVRIVGEDTSALVYVEMTSSAAKTPLTLPMKLVEGSWRVGEVRGLQ